jgi:hypothetical protein
VIHHNCITKKLDSLCVNKQNEFKYLIRNPNSDYGYGIVFGYRKGHVSSDDVNIILKNISINELIVLAHSPHDENKAGLTPTEFGFIKNPSKFLIQYRSGDSIFMKVIGKLVTKIHLIRDFEIEWPWERLKELCKSNAPSPSVTKIKHMACNLLASIDLDLQRLWNECSSNGFIWLDSAIFEEIRSSYEYHNWRKQFEMIKRKAAENGTLLSDLANIEDDAINLMTEIINRQYQEVLEKIKKYQDGNPFHQWIIKFDIKLS